jgi:hypothetical protein
VLVAAAEPLLAELEQLHDRYAGLLYDVAGLALLLDRRWGPAHPYRTHAGTDDGGLKNRVAALAVTVPDDPELQANVKVWAERAAELARDPLAGGQ